MNTRSSSTSGRRWRRAAAAVMALSLVAVACGSDDDGGDTDTDTSEAPTATDAPDGTAAPEGTDAPGTSDAPEGTDGETGEAPDLDGNGDGKVRHRHRYAGPARRRRLLPGRSSTPPTKFSAENGFERADRRRQHPVEPTPPTELDNLARQPVDIIIVGASEIADPMSDLTEQYSDIIWYCNCGAGFPESDLYLQSQDDGAEIAYTAGVATGIAAAGLRWRRGDDDRLLRPQLRDPDLMAFELGLDAVDATFELTYVPSGDFPFDFDNVPNASEAFENADAQGADAIYPYLGGAHEPIVKLANESGRSHQCRRFRRVRRATRPHYDIAVRFDGGDYVRAIFTRSPTAPQPRATSSSTPRRCRPGAGHQRRRDLRADRRAAGRDGRGLRPGRRR